MKTLFCTDGSKISYNAILNYSKWINSTNIDVLNVFDLRHLPDFIAIENNVCNSIYNNTSEQILSYSEEFFEENNLNLGKKIKMCGSTIDNILDIMENYDFIVLGSNGKKGIQKWLGSVSQEISAISKIPVFISKSKNNAKKLLLAIDYSKYNTNAISDCLDKLNLREKKIYIATVYELPDYLFLDGNIDHKWIKDVEKKQEKESAILLNNAENLFKKNNLQIKDKFILKGNPAKELINLSQKLDIDLIITGSNKKKNLASLLSNSVSLRILNNSKSDILIFKY